MLCFVTPGLGQSFYSPLTLLADGLQLLNIFFPQQPFGFQVLLNIVEQSFKRGDIIVVVSVVGHIRYVSSPG